MISFMRKVVKNVVMMKIMAGARMTGLTRILGGLLLTVCMMIIRM